MIDARRRSRRDCGEAQAGGHRARRRSRGPGGDPRNNPCRTQADGVVALTTACRALARTIADVGLDPRRPAPMSSPSTSRPAVGGRCARRRPERPERDLTHRVEMQVISAGAGPTRGLRKRGETQFGEASASGGAPSPGARLMTRPAGRRCRRRTTRRSRPHQHARLAARIGDLGPAATGERDGQLSRRGGPRVLLVPGRSQLDTGR
jgi:hypothetical protein